jgi:hypothetical protein
MLFLFLQAITGLRPPTSGTGFLAEGTRIRKRAEEEQSRKSYEERVKEFNDAAIRNKPPMTEEQIQRDKCIHRSNAP